MNLKLLIASGAAHEGPVDLGKPQPGDGKPMPVPASPPDTVAPRPA